LQLTCNNLRIWAQLIFKFESKFYMCIVHSLHLYVNMNQSQGIYGGIKCNVGTPRYKLYDRTLSAYFLSYEVTATVCSIRINQLRSWITYRSTKVNAVSMWTAPLCVYFLTPLFVKRKTTVPRILACRFLCEGNT